MKKVAAEPYRDFDFSRAKRGAVVKAAPGKTKISIRLDKSILDYFRRVVDESGGGSYQTLMNDALLAYIQQRSVLDAVRQVVREELSPSRHGRGLSRRSTGRRTAAPIGTPGTT